MAKRVVEFKKLNKNLVNALISRRALAVMEVLSEYPEGLKSIDIAEKLKVDVGSIRTSALQRLRRAGLVEYDSECKWKLTEKGKILIDTLLNQI